MNRLKLKILVIGFGSIGKRHCRNLLALGLPPAQIGIVEPNPKGVDEFKGVVFFHFLRSFSQRCRVRGGVDGAHGRGVAEV